MKKKALAKTQKKFWRGLLSKGDLALFTNGAKRGLQVYQDAYFLRIHDSLLADYPTAAKELGARKFQTVVAEYLAKNPSQHFSLRYMGKKFPHFLARHALSKKMPWLVEASSYEWLKLDLYDVADHPIVTPADLKRLNPKKWEGIRFQFVSHLRILRLQYSVEVSEEVNKLAALKHLAVWRKKEDVYYRRLLALEYKMLKLLRDGKTFGTVCEILAPRFANPEEAANFAFQSLSRWIFDEIIEEIR